LVTEYDLARKVLREYHLFSSRPLTSFESVLVGKDPPDHTEIRSLLQPQYSPKQLSTINSFTETLIRDKLDELTRLPSFDLVECLATPLAVETNDRVMGMEKGISQQLHQECPDGVFSHHNQSAIAFFEELFLREEPPEQQHGTIPFLWKMVRSGTLSLAQAVSLANVLWAGGTGNIIILLGNISVALLTNPDIYGQLRRQPERIRNFVEENLRLHPPGRWRSGGRKSRKTNCCESAPLPPIGILLYSPTRIPTIWSGPAAGTCPLATVLTLAWATTRPV
jgi:cytochrome P450